MEQAGTGPSRRHIRGSKIAKRLQRVNLQYSKIEKPKKIDRVARRCPLARAPGALKGGHFRNCQHFCRSWRVDPLEKKQIFEKKVSQCRKTERGDPLGFLNTQSVVKYQRNWRGKIIFGKKSHNAEKKQRGDPLGFSNMHSVAKQQKIEGWTLWSRPVWYVTREIRKNLFGSVR